MLKNQRSECCETQYIPRSQSCVRFQQREALLCQGELWGKNQVHINLISSKVRSPAEE